MSENEKNVEPELPAFVKKAPELIPLWDWWVKEGRSTAIMVAVAGLAVAAFYGARNWMRGRDAAASAALMKMASPNAMSGGAGLVEEQEAAVGAVAEGVVSINPADDDMGVAGMVTGSLGLNPDLKVINAAEYVM